MNRVLIIGISGTGKTWLAKKLSDFFKIPVTHYDELAWRKNWKEEEQKIVEQKLKKIITQDEWIIEGFIHPAAKIKLQLADTIIYLDYPGWLAAWGGLARWWKHRGKTRPEMAEGCVEKFDWKYLKVMWRRGERPEIEEAITGFENKIILLKTRKETEKFVANLYARKF